MPNTPTRPTTDRPDVEGIMDREEAEYGPFMQRGKDLRALIARIEELEARQGKLEAVVEAARAMSESESWRFLLKANQGGNNLLDALAALGDGDG